jgi:tetratricopeptide (TPR) repeat protein
MHSKAFFIFEQVIKQFLYIIFIFVAGVQEASSQGHFAITTDIREAYELVSSLKSDLARKKIAYIKKNDPDNMLVYHIENYVDFFEIFINEDKERFDQLKDNKESRLDKIKSGDPTSPFYRFSQAEIMLQWALARSKFNQKLTASRELLSAYSLLEENVRLFPEFTYNYKSLSIIHVLTRSIPGLLRFVFGIKGSIEQGTNEIRTLYEQSLKEDLMFEDEIIIIYAYILFYQNNQQEAAWELIEQSYLNKPFNNPFVSFMTANFGQKSGHNDLAIELLLERPRSPDAMTFDYLDFLIGKFKLYRLDQDADKYLTAYITKFKGQHYIKEAYQKMAWYRLVIHDDLAGYKKYMDQIPRYGEDLIDEDKQAQKEAKEGSIPHPDLLKARLLYDGAYYDRAYNLLIKRAYTFHDPYDLMEYNYRMGRISQALKNYPDAINYYIKAIKGKKGKSYFPCNAALQTALILEDQGRYNQALDYLEECLDMSPDEYKNSLHQKAKSAKQRIKEKMD